jgi:serine/threonine protein kinase
MPGSLRDALRRFKGGRLPWALKVRIARDVAEGLAFLHSQGLIHRDLKTSNILLDAGWGAKICDHSFIITPSCPTIAEFTCGA